MKHIPALNPDDFYHQVSMIYSDYLATFHCLKFLKYEKLLQMTELIERVKKEMFE